MATDKRLSLRSAPTAAASLSHYQPTRLLK